MKNSFSKRKVAELKPAGYRKEIQMASHTSDKMEGTHWEHELQKFDNPAGWQG